MLMLEHMDHLSETAAKAIANVKFDKVIVWDNGGGEGGGAGGNGVANFLRGLGSSLPPMLQIMKDIGGVEMPEFFGRLMSDEPEKTLQPASKAGSDAESSEAEAEAEPSGAPGAPGDEA